MTTAAPVVSVPSPTKVFDLLWTLVRTDFKSRYHGTLGGFAWALLKPFVMFVVLLAVFSFIFASDPGYKMNLIIGLFLFDFFAEATKVGLMSLYSKGYLLSKARFPSWILVVASASNALITLGIFAVVVTVFRFMTATLPSPVALALFVFYVLMFAVIVVGFSLAASVLFLRYRDLNQVWDVVIQAGFFLAPVVYPLRIIPERFHFYLYIWPPTPVIQFSRAVLVDGTIPTFRAHMMLVGEAACVLAIGAAIFRSYAPRAAEYL
jgi:lipopolysaccharide transport system permease protein